MAKYITITIELTSKKPDAFSSDQIAKQELRAPAEAKPERLGKIVEDACRVMLQRDHELWAGVAEESETPVV